MPFDLDGFLPAQGAPAGAEFYNANRDAPIDPLVPQLIENTSDIVQEYLNYNRTTAQKFINDALEAIEALGEAKTPEELPNPPDAPVITTTFDAGLGMDFDDESPGRDLTPEPPRPLTLEDVDIPDIDNEPEFVSLLTSPLAFPNPPADFVPPEVPSAPAINTEFSLPAAPAKSYGGAPDLDNITIPAMPAVALPVFGDTAPEFDETVPSPFVNWTEPVYTSSIKTAVAAAITEMLAGGTGIPADVEQGIWERGSEREGVAASIRVNAALSEWAARGFPHVQGELNARINTIADETQAKRNDLSRDVAGKQAELEQRNRQFAVTSGLTYEQVFVGMFLAVVERNFQIAKYAVEAQILIFNAKVAAFNARQQAFAQKVELYKAQLEAVLFHLKAYAAQVEAEKAKAEVNEAKVRAFEARVRAYSEEVKAYAEVVRSAQVRAELERSKVDIYRGQIEAMIGKINAQRATFEAYDVRVRAETAKVTAEEVNVRAYTGQVQAFAQRTELALSRSRAVSEKNRMLVDHNAADMQRITTLTGQQLSVIQARASAFQAATQRALAKFSAEKEGKAAELQANVSIANMAIAKYQVLSRQWEARVEQIKEIARINSEQLRTIGTMVSNLASGAMAGTHVSAGMSAAASAGQSSSRSSADNTSQSRTVSETNSYTVAHNYAHNV